MGRVLDYFAEHLHGALETARSYYKEEARRWPKVVAYVKSGKPDALKALAESKVTETLLLDRLTGALASPEAFGEEDRRVLHVLAVTKQIERIGEWLNGQLSEEGPELDRFGLVRAELEPHGVTAAELLDVIDNVARDGRPNSAGRALLALNDDQVVRALRGHPTNSTAESKLELLLDAVPERMPPVLEKVFATGTAWSGLYELALKKDPARYTEMVLAGLPKVQNLWQRFWIARALFERDPSRFHQVALETSRDYFRAGFNSDPEWDVEWMTGAFGTDILDAITEYVTRPREFFQGYDEPGGHPYTWSVLHAAVKGLGRAAIPAILAQLRAIGPEDRSSIATPLGYLIDLDDGTYDALIFETLDRELADPIVSNYGRGAHIEALELAARWKPERLTDRFWELLGHANKKVRDEVVPLLSRDGDEAVPRAEGLLSDPKPARRESAVALLARIGTPHALDALEGRRDVEKDERIRDAILLALDAAGRSPTPAQVEARIEQVAGQLKAPVAPWADEAKLPPLLDRDGRPLGALATRFLLWRQERSGEIIPDVEARPLYDRIDPASGAAFAETLLSNFLGTKVDAADRFALAVAGRLGDARVVPTLARLVDEWVKSGRGKMAEYAVQALALVRDEATLTALDAIARKYQQKPKNVAEAAHEAISAAAAALGITREELGDRVVPRLGFAAVSPRTVDCGGRQVEVMITPDFKLVFHDLTQKKLLKSLPTSAPKETKAELKDVASQLREVAKTQTRRLEDQMVLQRRWPLARWRELFLDHPVLFPFAVRLVWGAYDTSGKLTGTFRALEDRSLTDASDTPFNLPESGTVGIVHPLELDQPARQSWQTHLADHEVTPPFPQLERPVIQLPDDRRQGRRIQDVRGTKRNALSFKRQFERLGWVRGPVMGNASVEGYFKRFPVGVEAVLALEMMSVQPFPDQETTLEDVAFIRAGEQLPGYTPLGAESEPQLLPLGEVPAVVYSEVMGDLGRIAGPSTDEQDEE